MRTPIGNPMTIPTVASVVACHAMVAYLAAAEPDRLEQRELAPASAHGRDERGTDGEQRQDREHRRERWREPTDLLQAADPTGVVGPFVFCANLIASSRCMTAAWSAPGASFTRRMCVWFSSGSGSVAGRPT